MLYDQFQRLLQSVPGLPQSLRQSFDNSLQADRLPTTGALETEFPVSSESKSDVRRIIGKTLLVAVFFSLLRSIPEYFIRINLPVTNPANLQRVRCYLIEQRRLSARILQPLIASRKLYADRHGNAVFLMVAEKPNRSVGAELRGTGKRAWRGMAPGTCKDEGYFWIGERSVQKIVLCESAIDAISCFQLNPDRICISTAGVRPSPRWLHPLLARRYQIYCGFDDDETGNRAGCLMIARQPSVKRLRPLAHDWNDALTASL